MQKNVYFLMILVFLFSCTSERSFQVAPQNQLKVRKSQKAIKVDELKTEVSVADEPNVAETAKAKNTPPEIKSVELVSKKVSLPGDTYGVKVSGSDADGDKVTFLYEWMVNNEPAGKTSQLEVPLQRGDEYFVKITPFDGKEYGSSFEMTRTVLNMPPMIIEEENVDFDGKTYLYQVKAQDPDGDDLSYFLKTAPDAMTITPSTGLIVWDVPPEFLGVAKVFVVVEDGNGGKAHYDMNITITSEETSSSS